LSFSSYPPAINIVSSISSVGQGKGVVKRVYLKFVSRFRNKYCPLVAFVVFFRYHLREIVGDKERVGQVLINLITNAVKYSPRADRIIVHLTPTHETLTVSVQDFGIGIPKAHQEKVFERFYRVSSDQDRTYPGLGIGLYLAHQIIERYGGKMWVESVEGQGSTFSFSPPLPGET